MSQGPGPGGHPKQNAQATLGALVLAGRRGPDDPLAAAAGAPHRALLDIHGTPMLERVVDTLRASPAIGRIQVSIDEPQLLKEFPGLARRLASDELSTVPSGRSPATSVLQAIQDLPDESRILLTTADHPLLDQRMLGYFLEQSLESKASLTVGLVTATRIRERFPEAKRTYLRFADESYSGANLFALRLPEARRFLEFWTRIEGERKQPWKLVRAFGLGTLLLFLTRRLDLRAAFERASRVVGARAQAVVLPFAEAAVDVDKLSDWELVKEILADREGPSSRGPAPPR